MMTDKERYILDTADDVEFLRKGFTDPYHCKWVIRIYNKGTDTITTLRADNKKEFAEIVNLQHNPDNDFIIMNRFGQVLFQYFREKGTLTKDIKLPTYFIPTLTKSSLYTM
jgi:hypothetical protein